MLKYRVSAKLQLSAERSRDNPLSACDNNIIGIAINKGSFNILVK